MRLPVNSRIPEDGYYGDDVFAGQISWSGQAGVESPRGVTVRVPQGDDMGVAEKDFEGAGGHKDEGGMMKDEIYKSRYSSGVKTVKSVFPLKCLAFQVTKYFTFGVCSAADKIKASMNAMREVCIF